MTARFIVGDTRAVTATLPDGSVDFIMCSPPFLALRSYLPADHPDKANEIGSEATPAAFIDVMLELSAEWRRVLAPHGSIVVELGDTYAGPQPPYRYTVEHQNASHRGDPYDLGRNAIMGEHNINGRVGPGWPRAKSLVGIPERYRLSLIDGVNICNGQPSPAGRWQVRNVIRWVRPNPPVGALGKKWRPATSDLVVATPDDDRRYWDDVATRTEHVTGDALTRPRAIYNSPQRPSGGDLTSGNGTTSNPAGAPLLDWWKIVPKGYEGAHYAVYPPELCIAPIDAMCPRRVCRTCGRPSERVTEPSERYQQQRDAYNARLARLANGSNATNPNRLAEGMSHSGHGEPSNGQNTRYEVTTTGWTTCGHPGTDGLRLDGFHDGPGWRPGVVLDPFAGTGTTLSVATGMGRDAIGIDIDSRNASLALERVGPLLLTVEHLDPDRPEYVPTADHNQTGNPRFRVGYQAVHTALGTTQAPQKHNYGESA